MGRYKDYREPRRRQREDNQITPLEWALDAPAASEPPRKLEEGDAQVIWFNASKGFGFVKMSDGREAYLSARVLEKGGASNVLEGASLKILFEQSSKGVVVAEVLLIRSEAPAPVQSPSHGFAQLDEHMESRGTVKRYDPEKGFGFIAQQNGGRDIFVHATALSRAGIASLNEGQEVLVEVVAGKKGLEVKSIRIA